MISGRILLTTALLFGCWLCRVAHCATGSVRTSDGTTHQGEIRFGADGRVSVGTGGTAVMLDVAAIDRLEITPASSPAATRPASSAKADEGWTGRDIGEVLVPGRFTVSGDRMELYDGGRRLWRNGQHEEKKPAFYFVYKSIQGDGRLVARLRTLDDAAWAARGGLMLRETLRPDSPFVMIGRANGTGTTWTGTTWLQFSSEPGAQAQSAGASDRAVIGAVWLKLQRSGNRIEGFESLDGSRWSKIGSVVLLVPPDQPVYLGIAVASGRPGSRTVIDRIDLATEPASSQAAACPAGVVTRAGSLLPGDVRFADQTKVVLRTRDGAEKTLAAADVARLMLRDLDEATRTTLDNAAPGALLTNGDFVEGALQELDGGRLRLSSVLFGLRTYDAARHVAAIVLRKTAAGGAPFEVRTADGAILMARALKAGEDCLIVEEPVVGTLTIAANRLSAIGRKQP